MKLKSTSQDSAKDYNANDMKYFLILVISSNINKLISDLRKDSSGKL